MELTIEQLLEDPPVFQPTAEQEAILSAALSCNTSLMITAMAGCSKSTVLELLARKLPRSSCCYIVFNKKNQLEAQKKFASTSGLLSSFGSASHVDILTANGLGHRAWAKAVGRRLILDVKKVGNLTKQVLKENRADATSEDFVTIIQLVSRARHAGLVPKSYPSVRGIIEDSYDSWELLADTMYTDINEEIVYVARRVLTECIKLSYQGSIDFDDQIYMSALFGGVFPRYKDTFVDEAQDLSPLNHIQLKRTAADRLFIVGDPRQAIYAFRGADAASMGSMRQLRNDWIDLPLSITFRCPRVLVERQQKHAPGFTAAESNKDGQFLDWTGREWTAPEGKLAIICRNNAPLFTAALKLIKASRGCTILGKEIGKSLVNLAKKVVPNGLTSAENALILLHNHSDREISLARANGKEERVSLIRDKMECFEAIFDGSGAKTMDEAMRALENMFSSENLLITLSTGHKAKGMEWPTVIHLDPWRVPSKFARKAHSEGNPVPMEQDLNLRYVIETRAQETLILANAEDMK